VGLPYTNGRLLAIHGLGASADYDLPVNADGPERWRQTGGVGITVRQQQVESTGGGRVDEDINTDLKLPYDVGILVHRGDVLTYTYEGQQFRRKAGTIVHSEKAGRVRVALETG
jgi:hypothetical protein